MNCKIEEYKSYYKSPIGTIILTSDGINLTGLWFTTTRFKELTDIKENEIRDELEIFNITKKWLDKYFGKKKPNINEIPIKLIGTEFSKNVWSILEKIPYGKTITYGEIANQIAKQKGIKKMSAQAVGHAVGYNPISIIIPCHRVIGANGNLVGYGGGLDKKIKLLEIEDIDIKNLYIPNKGNAL